MIHGDCVRCIKFVIRYRYSSDQANKFPSPSGQGTNGWHRRLSRCLWLWRGDGERLLLRAQPCCGHVPSVASFWVRF